MDEFEQWTTEFNDTKSTRWEMGSIVMDSTDPIDCARQIRERLFSDQESDEERSRMQRLGLSALSSKYYGQYKERIPLEILINQGYAVPEPTEKLRKRTNTTRQLLTGYTFLRGTLSLISEDVYQDTLSGKKHMCITLRMSNPVVLDEFSKPVEDHDLPDYVITPVRSIIRYAFLYDQMEDTKE